MGCKERLITAERVLLFKGHLHRAGVPSDVANLTVVDYHAAKSLTLSEADLYRMITLFGNRIWSPDEGKVIRGRPETLLQVGDGILWNRLILDNFTPDGEIICPHCGWAGHLPTDAIGYAVLPDLTDYR